MGTLPSKDEGMGMCWSWFSASKWQESQRIGVLFLDWEWVKICQNDESIPQNRWLSTTKNCYFCGSKRYTANGLAENAAFPLAVPSISIRTPLSTRHLQIQMLATEKIRFRQLDFTKECRNVSKTQGYSRRGLVLFPSKITQPLRGHDIVLYDVPRTFWRCCSSHIQPPWRACASDTLRSAQGSNRKQFQHVSAIKQLIPCDNQSRG